MGIRNIFDEERTPEAARVGGEIHYVGFSRGELDLMHDLATRAFASTIPRLNALVHEQDAPATQEQLEQSEEEARVLAGLLGKLSQIRR